MLWDILSEMFLGVIMILDTLIYTLIGSAYKIFMAIASARLLSSDVYYDIAGRVYVVIGVVMLFVLSYAILKAIVDPDQATKGDLGPGMVKRVIIAVIGLAITPSLFNVLYQAQGLFLEQDVLGKVIFRIDSTPDVETSVGGETVSGNPDKQIKNIGGDVAASSIWYAFFHPSEGNSADQIIIEPEELEAEVVTSWVLCGLGALGTIALGIASFGTAAFLTGGATVALCASAFAKNEALSDVEEYTEESISLDEAYAISSGGGGFEIYLVFMDKYLDGQIDYYWGISTICGAFALYAFASFSIDMGVRAAKLAYYQIIAPIPLIMQVLPKYKENFGKYIGSVISTFLEVFIRISVVYIVVYVVCHLQDLFSSFGSLWGNESLNLAEKALALAFLILGLIIFAKSAPDLICESLKLNKGSMKLGIGKKLADGGAFAAGGIGYAGATSAVRNWRKAWGDSKDKKGWERAKHLAGGALSGVAGAGSGMARAAFNQFGPGPGRKPAQTWGDMKNTAEKAAQGATDKRDQRDERQADWKAADDLVKDLQQQEATETDPDKKRKLRDAIKDAEKRRFEATFYGRAIDGVEKRIDAWSAGTVDLSRENADIKFAQGLDKLKGEAREEAFKKDATTKALKSYYEELQARKVSEYRDGWDDESYNQELRSRLARDHGYTSAQATYRTAVANTATRRQAVDTAKADLETVDTQLETARQTGNAAEIARLEALRNTKVSDLNAAQAALETASRDELSAESGLASARKTVVSDLDLTAKRSENELAKERSALEIQRKAAKDAYEAAADAFVAVQAADITSNVYQQLQSFISQNSDYIARNADRRIAVKVDANGNVTEDRSVRAIISDAFGASAMSGTINTTHIQDNHSFVLTDAAGSDTYKYNASTKKYVGANTGKEYSVEDFFNKVLSALSNEGGTVKAKTSVSEVADTGKDAAKAVQASKDFQQKVTRKRAEEGKK